MLLVSAEVIIRNHSEKIFNAGILFPRLLSKAIALLLFYFFVIPKNVTCLHAKELPRNLYSLRSSKGFFSVYLPRSLVTWGQRDGFCLTL